MMFLNKWASEYCELFLFGNLFRLWSRGLRERRRAPASARETGARTAGGHLRSATVQPDRQPPYLDMFNPHFRFDTSAMYFCLPTANACELDGK